MVGTLEHDLFLCPPSDPLWVLLFSLGVVSTSLFVPSLSPSLGALFNGSTIKKSFPKVGHQAR